MKNIKIKINNKNIVFESYEEDLNALVIRHDNFGYFLNSNFLYNFLFYSEDGTYRDIDFIESNWYILFEKDTINDIYRFVFKYFDVTLLSLDFSSLELFIFFNMCSCFEKMYHDF